MRWSEWQGKRCKRDNWVEFRGHRKYTQGMLNVLTTQYNMLSLLSLLLHNNIYRCTVFAFFFCLLLLLIEGWKPLFAHAIFMCYKFKDAYTLFMYWYHLMIDFCTCSITFNCPCSPVVQTNTDSTNSKLKPWLGQTSDFSDLRNRRISELANRLVDFCLYWFIHCPINN